MNRENDIPVYQNLKKYIYESLTNINLKIYIEKNNEFSKRLFHPLVSLRYTTYIFKSKKVKIRYLVDFYHKVLDKSLPTRLKISNLVKSKRYISLHNTTKAKNIITKYNDCYCMYCANEREMYLAENTVHVFLECSAIILKRALLYSQLLEVINSF